MFSHLFCREYRGDRKVHRYGGPKVFSNPFAVDETHIGRRALVQGFNGAARGERYAESAFVCLELADSIQGGMWVGDEDGTVHYLTEKSSDCKELVFNTKFTNPGGQGVYSMCSLSCGVLAVGSGNRSVDVYFVGEKEAALGAHLKCFEGTVKFIRGIANCPTAFLAGSRGGDIKLRDIRLGTGSNGLSWHINSSRANSVTGLAVSSDSLIFAAAAQGFVSLWDLRKQSKQPLQTILQAGNRGISCLNFDPSGSHLALNHVKGNPMVCRWMAAASTNVRTMSPSTYKCNSFFVMNSFSPCGNFLASGSSDAAIYIWDLKTALQTPLMILQGHTSEVSSVIWDSRNFERIVSISDNEIITWKVNLLQAIKRKEINNGMRIEPSCQLKLLHRAKPSQFEFIIQNKKVLLKRPRTLEDFWDKQNKKKQENIVPK